ncbi:unnamed protein product [Rotaria sp. Silwood1]|nr:unnamed protein product [Rotaria sp. Silwood1]CAF1587740.1 unnamed protein product [Rotaria sp. Silwood1]CAF1589121.1 unnamed protein product [Rotaria sp. Silwood1]CAF3713236.1 unnamed protein product [Rotaria sp. Silwood1]CAF3810325.1 unnamed protein product [Rotaria sp. Silwood1]
MNYLVHSPSIKTDDYRDIKKDDDDKVTPQVIQVTSFSKRFYRDSLQCGFKEHLITRGICDYDLEEPTVHVRRKSIKLCQS